MKKSSRSSKAFRESKMLAAALSLLGGIAGLILWFLKRKSPLQRSFEEIERERLAKLRDIDSWWLRRP